MFNDESSEGEDYVLTFNDTQEDGTARDITGATIRVRFALTEEDGAEVLAEQTATVTDGPGGVAVWTMTATEARALRALGDSTGNFVRQVHCTYASGTEEMWLRGRHKLTSEV